MRRVTLTVRRRRAQDPRPDWPIEEGYPIQIDWSPTIRAKLSVSPPPDSEGTTFLGFMVFAMILASIPAVNAIPNVVAAAPGITTFGIPATDRHR